jgi:hypothetical protein
MKLDEAYKLLTDKEADAIGYMVAAENLERYIIAAATAKLKLVRDRQLDQEIGA